MLPGLWVCTYGGHGGEVFVSPIDLSGGPISCEYTTKEQWLNRLGPSGIRLAWYYVKLLARLFD